jgi:hypothetical protein
MALEPHDGATEALALLGGEVRQNRRVEDHGRRFSRRPCRERRELFDQISPYDPRSLSARNRDGLPQALQTVQLLRPHQGLEPPDGLGQARARADLHQGERCRSSENTGMSGERLPELGEHRNERRAAAPLVRLRTSGSRPR